MQRKFNHTSITIMSCHLHNSIPKIDVGLFCLLSDPKIEMLTAKRDVTPMSWAVMVRFTSLFLAEFGDD